MRWLHAARVDNKEARRGQTFDTLELALAAATRGQGVAIGDLNLVRESLRDGILVAPFKQTIERGLSYYLVYPPDRAEQPKIKILREWLTTAARLGGDAAPGKGKRRQGSTAVGVGK